MDIDEIKKKVLPILKRHEILRAGILESAARQETTEVSDIDILVQLAPQASLFDLVRVKQELEASLGKKVGLVEYCTVKPRLRERIQTEQVTIL